MRHLRLGVALEENPVGEIGRLNKTDVLVFTEGMADKGSGKLEGLGHDAINFWDRRPLLTGPRIIPINI